MELLVVMVITSLVLYLGFLVLSFSLKQINQFTNTYENNQNLLMCYYEMEELFYQADKVRIHENSILFEGKKNFVVEVGDSSVIVLNESGISQPYSLVVSKLEVEQHVSLLHSLQLNIQGREGVEYIWTFEKQYDLQTLYEESIK